MPNQNKTICELLNEAIAIRERYKGELTEMKDNLDEWSQYVTELLPFMDNERWLDITKNSRDVWNDVVDKLNKLKKTLIELGFCGSYGGKFASAFNRVSRPYVNLGIVGPFRQGKSTLMRKLVQVDDFDNDWLFPVQTGDDACTGAPINYINKLYTDEKGFTYNGPTAIIKYYKVKEVCQIINNYIDECGLDKLIWGRIENQTQQGLKDYCLNHRQYAEKMPDANPNTYKKVLKYYIIAGCENDSYIDLLDKDDDTVSLNNDQGKQKYMRSISFFESVGANLNDRKYFVYATREADVYLKFKVNGEDVGQIRFLDTPGIGEKRLTVGEGLGEKLQNDMDLVIAINKLDNGTQTDSDVTDFHNILKNKFDCECIIDGKLFHSSEFIYYIMNCALGDCPQENIPALLYGRYQRIYNEGLEMLPKQVTLPSTHKVIANCKYDQYYNYSVDADNRIILLSCNGSQNSQTFLYNAIQNLSSSIKAIDQYFSHSAIELYDKAKREKNALDECISRLILPQAFAVGSWVGKKMKEIYKELSKYTLKTDITKQISNNIASFAELDTCGSEVIQLFPEMWNDKMQTLSDEEVQQLFTQLISEINNDSENSMGEDDPLEDFLNNLAEKIEEKLVSNGTSFCAKYNALGEFEEYSNKKKIFSDQVGKNIKRQIDPITAKDTIEDIRKKIWSYLKRNENLGFVTSRDASDEDWYESLIDLLRRENRLLLLERFTSLREYTLDIDKEIEDHILDIINPIFHLDKLDSFSFRSASLARRTFLRSLLNIEKEVKEDLRNTGTSKVETLRQTCNNLFRAELDTFAKIAESSNEKGIDTEKYEQFRDFLQAHIDQILERSGTKDEEMLCQGLIDKWNELTKKK